MSGMRGEGISTLERIGALRQAGSPLMVEFATSISSGPVCLFALLSAKLSPLNPTIGAVIAQADRRS
jgi:hypothetical protein